jgi:ABC-type Zn uptake system ZnuABC Zn-binding protein ZnuA
MAQSSGWWELKTTVEPSTTDLEHIAELIEQGSTSGEITEDEVEEDD